ncbi:MAG: hypothetical protein EOL87_05255 [Spartobacteria bacterium]|nr:hypothetical protein [Spartobacteria bacterium]
MIWIKRLIGLLLIPVSSAALHTLYVMLYSMTPRSAGNIPLLFVSFSAGFIFWLLIYFMLPKPTMAYFLGHECTHVLWAWILGEQVRNFRITRMGGSVDVSSSHFMITLAPYFFPLYCFCVVLLHYVCSHFMYMGGYDALWLAAIGFTWAFHVTFTVSALATRQRDVDWHGRIFSYVIIILFNALGLIIWIVAVTPITFEQVLVVFTGDVIRFIRYLNGVGDWIQWRLYLMGFHI